MDESKSTTIQDACRLLLRPVASVLLKCGMTWKEFSAISKSVFVEMATEEYGIRGRPTNISRVSVLTGISRKEVKRQRDLLQASNPTLSRKTTDATRVLAGWYQDSDFLDPTGQPLPLPEQGPSPSFAALYSRYGGDAPQQTLLKELRNAKSIESDEQDRLVALTRYHMPVAMTDGNIQFFGTNLYDHAQALNNNMSTASGAIPRFEGFAVDDRIDPESVEAFKEYIDQRGQAFLEEVDDWLNRHQVPDADTEAESVRLGVGVYAVKGPLPKG